jgi:hypothetical protein
VQRSPSFSPATPTRAFAVTLDLSVIPLTFISAYDLLTHAFAVTLDLSVLPLSISPATPTHGFAVILECQFHRRFHLDYRTTFHLQAPAYPNHGHTSTTVIISYISRYIFHYIFNSINIS